MTSSFICYFCKDPVNNPETVHLFDGRNVDSCLVCRTLVADSQEESLDNNFGLNGPVLGILNQLEDSITKVVGGHEAAAHSGRGPL